MNTITKNDLHSLEIATIPFIKEAGDYILKNWHIIRTRKFKNERDLATNVDSEVENKLRNQLQLLLPEAGFIVEEGKSSEKGELNWTIDPIDGTKNFAYQYPLFYIQVALLYKNDPILGLVYNPVSSQLFSASKGNGAKLNQTLLKETSNNSLKAAIVDVDFGGNDQIIDWKLKILSKLLKSVYRVRMTGGFGSTYMLTGAFDAAVYLNLQSRDKYIVDNAPRIILLQEAGFQIQLLEESNNKKIFLAANKTLISDLLTILRD